MTEEVKRGRFSDAEREQIAEWADEGLSASIIAQRLNRLPASVNGQFALQSLRPPKPREFRYFRNGVEVRSFSGEEVAFITALRVQNFGISKIADLCTRRFGHPRRPHTINMRLRQLAAEATEND